ncbi:TetR/AcrR family transcriptional regulator [Serratia symbiotica]|uniref:TetR/AcrR family transcriptional regulator n=1 Tax=Serratia symbiotica TaxID=138074 RepID=UPI00132427BD|nr:TetR/AcrR family transcriptional regulator [Serratia symbiotica]QTP14872.1 TetR/AcrR family transcriptional regulator [Serratia symbiotica]
MMNQQHKPAHIRQQKLLQIIRSLVLRKQTLSISRVAREAGISPSLIHNHYPDIAAKIRQIAGYPPQKSESMLRKKLHDTETQNRALREEIHHLRLQISQLSSINEMLNSQLCNELNPKGR